MISDIKSIFLDIPTLTTKRLTLRRIKKKDIADIFDYTKKTETSKFLLWYPHASLADSKRYFKVIDKKYKKGLFYDWGIIDNESGRMIGTCGFSAINLIDNKAEIGYVINPDFKGRGIATEAVKRVLEFGFKKLHLERIEARYIIGNDASRRVMEKCFMRFEGICRGSVRAKGRYFDIGICSILSEEYFYLKTTNTF